MFKNLWKWILTNIFRIKTQTTDYDMARNEAYAKDYRRIDQINFDAIFGNKLANYVMNDSTLEIKGDNRRSELLNDITKQVWKKGKKITLMAFGTGGVALIPYSKNGKLYYNIVEQDRITIDSMDGEDITGATILAEMKVVNNLASTTKYFRWANYRIENGTLIITQRYTNEDGRQISTPDFWLDIQEEIRIYNVKKVAFALLKSPKDNRRTDDKYGVPITYGCESTIEEIRECLKQIAREFELKKAFVGTDVTMFGKDHKLPEDGLYRAFDANKDDFWELFSPDIRESSFYARLQELYSRLETEVGVSSGILTKTQTQNATATEIRLNMYDTFTVIDNMRSNIEEAMDTFLYACDVIANTLNLSPMGEYEISFNWDYTLLQDIQEDFNQMTIGVDKGVISKAELRNWIKPDETMEESIKAIQEIDKETPDIRTILGGNNANS